MHEVVKGYDDSFVMLYSDQLDALMGGKMKPSCLAVFVALLRRANRKRGNTCFPSIKTISVESGVSLTTTKDAIRDLAEAGLLTVQPRRSPEGDATSNLYTLLRPGWSDSDGGRSGDDRPVGRQATDGVGRQTTTNQMNSEPDEKEPESDADASVARPKPKRANDEAISLIDAYTEASGHPFPASRGAAINVAKNLVRAGITPEDVAGCTRWMMGDPFWQSKGFDWANVVKSIDKWRGQQARGVAQKPQTITERFGTRVDPVAASAVPRKFHIASTGSQSETNGGQR